MTDPEHLHDLGDGETTEHPVPGSAEERAVLRLDRDRLSRMVAAPQADDYARARVFVTTHRFAMTTGDPAMAAAVESYAHGLAAGRADAGGESDV